MQITVNRGELKTAVAGLGKVVSVKSTLPVLSHVRFEARGGAVTVEGTDLDQTARYRFSEASASGDGALLLPLANLKELAKGSDRETLDFESGESGRVTIINHVGRHAIKHPVSCIDPEEWPVCPKEVPTEPAEGFLSTYRKLAPFACNDETRYTINSVFVDVQGKGVKPVTLVATDGRRLTCCNSLALPLKHPVIIPTRKFLSWSGLSGEVGLALRTEQLKDEVRVLAIAVSVGPWSYDLKAIDGTYPGWRQVVPGKPEGRFNTLTLTDEDVTALKKILPSFPGCDTGNEPVGFERGEDGRLVIVGKGAEDKAVTRLELTGGSTLKGKAKTGVSRRYLLDALEAGFREFTYTDSDSPLRSEDGKGGIHVLMPVRLGIEAEEAKDKAPEAPEEPKVVAQEQPKGEATMTKENEEAQGTALDKVLAAVEAAKTKLRESTTALVDVADAVKTALKEGKAQAADLEKARATLQKLQAISL